MTTLTAAASAVAGASAPPMKLPGPVPMLDNLTYSALDNMAIAAFVLVGILLIARYSKGFLGNVSVMFGMVAATGIRILANVDFKANRHNLYIVAIAIGAGMIPLVAPRWSQQMPHALHPLLESGILLTAIAAVALNLYFNGSKGGAEDAISAAKMAEAH